MSKTFLKEGMNPHAAVGRVVSCIKPLLRNTGEGRYSGSILYKGVLIFLISRSCLCKDNRSFSSTFASCGRTDIWRKSLFLSFGGFTFGTGQINACLYRFGYLHWMMFAHMMLCTTRASSSLKRFNSHAGTPSIPVAFLGFRCLNVHFTCLMEGKGGGTSFKRWETVWRSGTSVGLMFYQGLINACCTVLLDSVALAGRI